LVSEIEEEKVLVEVREYIGKAGRYRITANVHIGETKIEMQGTQYSDIIHTLGHLLLALTDYIHQP